MDPRIRSRAQMAVDADAAIGMIDISGRQIQRVDIGDTAGAVDDAIGFRRMLGTPMHEDHTQPSIGGPDALYADPGLVPNARPFALGRQLPPRLGVPRGAEFLEGPQ